MLDLLLNIIIFYAPAFISNLFVGAVGGIFEVKKLNLGYCGKAFKNSLFIPLDKGKIFIDGKRIFGDSNTFFGLLAYPSVASIVGFAEGLAFGSVNFYTLFGFLQGIGAFLGELFKSFFKRRLGIPRGGFKGPTLILDWTNHIIGATLLLLLLVKIEFWFFFYAFMFTLITHPILCYVGHKLGLKKNPW